MSETAETLLALGYEARRERRPDEAKRFFADAVSLSRADNSETTLAKAVTGAGQIERDLQHTEAALAHYREAETIYRRLSNVRLLAHTLRHIGDILRVAGRFEEAGPYLEETLAIYRQRKDTPELELANTLRICALLSEKEGRKEQARAFWEEARSRYEAVGAAPGVRESEEHLRES